MNGLPSTPDLEDARRRAVCWLLRKGLNERAICHLRWAIGDYWELRLDINGAFQWSARCRDPHRVLAAVSSWRRALTDQGWW